MSAPTATTAIPAELQGKFDLGIWHCLFNWPTLTVAVQNQWGGPDSAEKRDWLAGQISEQFEREPSTDAEDVEVMLLQVLEDEYGCRVEDETEVGIARDIMRIRKEVGEGNTSSIDAMHKKWEERKGKEVATGNVQVRESNQEAEWDSVDEESGEDEDVDMDDAPALVPAKPKEPKAEPEIDEDGFEKVVGKKRSMDSAYDHIQEKNYPEDEEKKQPGESSAHAQPSNFNTEVQEAYKAISSSPWAARLGGFWQTAKKQASPQHVPGEQYYETAASSKQYKEATAGVSSLISHARNLSVQANDAAASTAKDLTHDKDADKEDMTPHPDRPESLTADIVKEAQGIVSLFRSNASKRLKELQKAEDAADEALLKFGSNVRNFLAEAVTIAAPASGSQAEKDGAVLFESKDSSGKKVVHATRFDAQLHVIHSTLDSFLKDPASPQWDAWKKDFDAEKKTDAIAKDLEKHEELRNAMEKVVPEKVDYATFWCRYYFLRHVIESEEQRRREMLKASTPADEEEVDWSSGSESDDDEKPTPKPAVASVPKSSTPDLAKSQTTIKPDTDTDTLKPAQPRRSNDEKSVADSDASYDVVSGATSRAPSRAPGSPKAKVEAKKTVEEESDDDDWE
ncbi:hypothetical protein E8E12_009953 [Didymella heteroderae]|uniref:BSD domain-containing protein n=1 Tax=Didymella heteroderae TaxID=1769908 RepID=A0A9P5C324_9PLEO|nr:hypothetical protein E8E12_009953 [Didymella heteroderae]